MNQTSPISQVSWPSKDNNDPDVWITALKKCGVFFEPHNDLPAQKIAKNAIIKGSALFAVWERASQQGAFGYYKPESSYGNFSGDSSGDFKLHSTSDPKLQKGLENDQIPPSSCERAKLPGVIRDIFARHGISWKELLRDQNERLLKSLEDDGSGYAEFSCV